jgi:hypothetical protein
MIILQPPHFGLPALALHDFTENLVGYPAR